MTVLFFSTQKVYKTSWEQTRASGYDFRIDAIPFQTAKASREIASDVRIALFQTLPTPTPMTLPLCKNG